MNQTYRMELCDVSSLPEADQSPSVSVCSTGTDRAGFYQEVGALQEGLIRLERALGSGPYFSGAQFSLADAAYAPFFRYLEVIERFADFGLFRDVPRVRDWRAALAIRPSVRAAVSEDYARRLQGFLLDRGSYLSDILVSAGGIDSAHAASVTRSARSHLRGQPDPAC